ncbi:hypothetical protein NliqN6_1512 [Naganishia liquefaciens]|uniref:Transmembrane protein n=1 Tax=Naganishia liquefaciens TaxID=104408 RepID=A0A8H3TR76_9TREE|nr:hypothetical protein NliqN6_1512 [Naganishia liquefaciens]
MLSVPSMEQQPTIVFTPSTPVMSPADLDSGVELEAIVDLSDDVHCKKRSRRASFYRSFTNPAPSEIPPPRQPVVLHRPRSTSPFGSRWTFATARRSVMDSCWKSEDSARAMASGISDSLTLTEKPTLTSRTACEPWTGARRAWADMEEDEDLSEPDSTPATPVFPHRAVAASAFPRHGSRFITLMSTLVIALALASLAFTTFFHPTFGNKISKLPASDTVPAGDNGWTHGFFHMDGLFGHSDEDGLVGISSADHLAASHGGELRKRSPFGVLANPYLDPNSLAATPLLGKTDPEGRRPHRFWRPWSRPFAIQFDEDEERVAAQHRRIVDEATRRMHKRREALSKRSASQLRR